MQKERKSRKRTYLPIGHIIGYRELLNYEPDALIGDCVVRMIKVRCVCGREDVISYHNFRFTGAKSCGCKRIEMGVSLKQEKRRMAKLMGREIAINAEIAMRAEQIRFNHFMDQMRECEVRGDGEKAMHETMVFLYPESPERWTMEKEEPPKVVGDFIVV